MIKVKKQLESFRQKDVAALRKALLDARVLLQKNRIDLAFGRLSKPTEVSRLRKEVAQISTLLAQKETAND